MTCFFASPLPASYSILGQVHVLGALSDDDDVDVLVARADARIRLAGRRQGVQLELVP